MLNQKIDLTQLPVMPTVDWMESFAMYLHERDEARNTMMAYLQDVRHFARFFEHVNQQVFTPEQLNAVDVKAYFHWQDEDVTVAVNSRNRRLSSLRVLVRWGVEAGVLEYDPTVSIKRKSVEMMPRDRSDYEMEKLEAVVRAGSHILCAGDGHAWLALRDRVIWWAFVYTGCRIHEVVGLNVSSLNLVENKITLIGKGNKKATISVPSGFMSMLGEWIDKRPVSTGDALITGWDGKRLSRSQVWRRIKMIGSAAGIPDLKPHDIRHWYAYRLKDRLIEQGISEEKALDGVRKQLRHGDVKTTLGYFRAAVEAM